MKKITSIIICLICLFSFPLNSFATDTENLSFGITYSISENWELIPNEKAISYQNKDNYVEAIVIECFKNDGAYNIDSVNKDFLFDICNEQWCSDERLSKHLSEKNNREITVTTDAVKVSYEKYNGIKYFRYEKAYTARADGLYSASFYRTVFITAKNGRLYFIRYVRDNYNNHFKDVIELLNNISYKPGEIKVEYNGEIIECDVEPIMYNERTMVPVRAVAEKMGYSVGWDHYKNMVILSSNENDTVYEYVIDSKVAVKNHSEEIELDVPAILIGKKAYLPVRAVAEAMDAKVNWIEQENKVQIIK